MRAFLTIGAGSVGLTAVACAQGAALKADAYLIEVDQPARKISLLAANGKSIRYLEADGSGEVVEILQGERTKVFVCEPPEFSDAMDLYQGRKYQEARIKFAGIKVLHDPIKGLEDSYATLSAFYEMECFRKLGDLDGLAAALQNFSKGVLTREHQLRQLELYVLWDAVRTENWVRLEELARERVNVKLNGDQRAQVAYCHGLALEGLKRPREALVPYQVALTAGAGAAEDLARKAALRILAIHLEDPEVRQALEAPGCKVGASPVGEAKLAEAVAVTTFFNEFLSPGTPLPPRFEVFLK